MANLNINNYELTEKNDTFLEKLIGVKRNAKVAKGGRVFGFSALAVVGDGNGKIGVGRGKAKEVPIAIQKAMTTAKRNFVSIKLNKGTIHYKIIVKFCSTKIVMLPASEGTGIISSFVMRSVFEAVGIKNIFAKCFGSKNHNNLVYCAIKGLYDMTESMKASSYRKSLLIKKHHKIQ